MYALYKETLAETTLDAAWEFISHPANLNLITPDDMEFEILTDLPDEMYDGLLVAYRVKIPAIGNRLWLSELKHIVHKRSFVDEQKIGPYKLWYHYHAIEETQAGIRFIDHVTYEVPFGVVGKAMHALFIRKTLDRIFDCREQRMRSLLNTSDR